MTGWNFFDNTSNITDNNGHGTAIAGVIAANPFTYQNVQYQGIAPNVEILPLKIAGQTGAFAS